MKKILLLLYTTFLISCLSVASVSDFSQTADSINFEKYATEFKKTSAPFWTFKSSNEYYFEKDKFSDEQKLISAIKSGFSEYGYTMKVEKPENHCFIAKRGLMLNEYGSVTAVYYKFDNQRLQVYLQSKITQDVTGGWGNNLAMNIGKAIEKKLD